MEIYLIRHTSVAVAPGICYGQKDVDLSDTYSTELEEVKNSLKDLNFDVVYSSPLTRAKRLANDIYKDNVVIDDRLMELNFGDWEGKVWDEIRDPNLEKWMEDFVNRKCSNGESFVMLKDRVLEFWNELRSKNYNKVAVFTHGGVIRTFQSIEKNIKLEDSFNAPTPAFGEVVILNLS